MKKTSAKLSETNDPSKGIRNDEPQGIFLPRPDETGLLHTVSNTSRESDHMARWLLDYEHDRLIWSDGIYKILEIDPAKHPANYFTFLEIIHPNDRHIKINAQERLKSSGKPIEINYRLQFGDGRVKWVNEICTTDFDPEKRPLRSLGTLQDITRFKPAAEKILKKNDQFSRLIEYMPQGIAIIQANTFALVNSSGRRLFGDNPADGLTGKNISLILAPDTRERFMKIFSRVINGSTEPTFEAKLKTLAGNEFDAEITLIQTVFQNNPSVQLIASDLTERKKTEILLRQNEKRLKETIATKDKFLSIIAHDLRSPFNSIIGFLEMLKEQYDDFNDEERKNYISLIYENAIKTLNLLDNLLVWARAQTGKVSFTPATQKLYPIVKQVSETMDSPLQLKQLQLKIAVPPELEIYADTNMLKTIIRNLLSNAIKYSLPKGLIVIEAATTGKYSKITVSDSGIGMSPEIRSKIFRIDEHISNPGTANETGSGLGLILCKDFINRHQGQVSVESEPGKGCTFTLLFPAEHVRKISGNL
jgi:PAS domain S-box-containing protein